MSYATFVEDPLIQTILDRLITEEIAVIQGYADRAKRQLAEEKLYLERLQASSAQQTSRYPSLDSNFANIRHQIALHQESFNKRSKEIPRKWQEDIEFIQTIPLVLKDDINSDDDEGTLKYKIAMRLVERAGQRLDEQMASRQCS